MTASPVSNRDGEEIKEEGLGNWEAGSVDGAPMEQLTSSAKSFC